MKKRMGDLILQIIPVMIGVYLGFVVSSWAENRKVGQNQFSLLKILRLK
jgi:hypothetical protein